MKTSPSIKRFRDLHSPYRCSYGDIIRDLTHGHYTPDDLCHCDPDIDANVLPRKPGWRGAFGQAAAAQRHLANQGVGVGDLFLFFGLFREAVHDGSWRFVGSKEHRIWGWLQIGEVIDLGPDGSHALKSHPWLCDHPHVRPRWKELNTLYIASEKLTLDGHPTGLPGAGVLSRGHRFSVNNDDHPSIWRVPDWLNPKRGGCGMTYHPVERWSADGTVHSAARGQEFVAAPEGKNADAVEEWVRNVLLEKTP
jgi:hypothetical protein